MTRVKRTPSASVLSIPTPLGELIVTVAQGAIVSSAFRSRAPKQSERSSGTDARLRSEIRKQVARYFEGKLERFTLPLAFDGTVFECDVWRQVAQLRFGEFVSYADVARACGRPLSHRGVARAMGRTQHALFVPAQRVVGADGKPRGLSPKGRRAWLIRFERRP